MKPARSLGWNADWDDIGRRLERSRQALEELSGNGQARQEEILQERAASLAKTTRTAAGPAPSADAVEVLVFKLAGELYAFEAAYVAHVRPMAPITHIPMVPDHVVGIIPMEGEVLSVIDLRSLLDLPLSRLAEPEAIIVLRGKGMEFGVLAESIIGIRRYRPESLQADLPTLADIEKTYLKCVTRERTAVLDAARLLSDPRLVIDAG